MKLFILPISVLIITSYLLSKIPHEPKASAPKITQVQSQPNLPAQPEKRPETISDRNFARADLDTVALLVKAESDKVFGSVHWPALYKLVMKESSWNPQAINPTSKSCGLFQAYPCSKMGGMELSNQIKWGLSYIKARYGTPTNALAYHINHGWY